MIWTVTPNPALDVSGAVDRLLANEKNYVDHEIRSPGGNAINAARMIHRLGAAVTATGFLGPSAGGEVRRLLQQEGLRTRFVGIAQDTRINVTVSNRFTHEQTRLSFPGPRIGREELRDLRDLLARARPSLAVIGGSLPPGVTPAEVARWIGTWRKEGVETLVDAPAGVLRRLLVAGPLLVKPNLEEFHALSGTRVSSVDGVVREARRLCRRVPLVCVSSVQGGAVLVTAQRAWFGRPPPLKVRSTVGAGDSMVGAFAALLAKSGRTSRDAVATLDAEHGAELLRFALGAACATLKTPGTSLGEADQVRLAAGRVSVTVCEGKGRFGL